MLPRNPPENVGKPKVFWRFQVDQMRTLGRKDLTHDQHYHLHPLKYKELIILIIETDEISNFSINDDLTVLPLKKPK